MTMNYRNPKYCQDGVRIDCEIEHPVYGWIPFLCDPTDTGAQFDVQELHQRIIDDGNVASMTQEEINSQIEFEVLIVRDQLLTEVNSIASNALAWMDLTQEQQQALSDYRHALLDVPQQPDFPHQVVWPVSPL